ncbi:MAG: TIR domain-containing protein [Desulfobacterales bacterium]|nr:TIR domain-containing protein [Desulfobacterales bacterium]
MIKLFLSHSSKDKKVVRKIATDLQNHGYQIWFDEWKIFVGESITQKIEKGLEDSDFVVVILSSYSVESGWVAKEWQSRIGREATEKQVHILPIRLENCKIPQLLLDKKYADFSNDYKSGLNELLISINNISEKRLNCIDKDNSKVQTPNHIKKLLIVEDDISTCDNLKETFLHYKDSIVIKTAFNAGEAFDLMISGWTPEAIILDIMLPYGTAGEILNEKYDPEHLYAGFRLLEKIRENDDSTWVSVITARNSPKIIRKIDSILSSNGRIYIKPFNDMQLENDLVLALGLKSNVPPYLLSI